MLNPFSNRNTWFVAKLRNVPIKNTDIQPRFSSPKKKKAFNENANYACIPNFNNNSIYLNEATYSGKLLNSQNLSRESANNKFIFPDAAESYAFDKVYNENCEYNFLFILGLFVSINKGRENFTKKMLNLF